MNRGGTAISGILGQAMQLIKPAQNKDGDPLRFLSEPLPVINCANGELWFMKNGKVKLRPHRASSFLRYCLNIKYDPEAKSPRYDQAIKEIFSEAKPSIKGMCRHWNELLGYLIQGRRDIAIIGVFRGGGDNGKTTLMRTVMSLLAPDMVSAQSIESLENRFAMGNLLGKHLLLDDDVKDGIRLPDGLLKKISEAKVVTGEHKHGKQFNFVVRAVPILLCNNVPSLADMSHGMRRRLMVIPFDRTFLTHEKDDEVFRHIWREEMSGVLNRAISGIQRLEARKMKFRMPEAVSAATGAWLTEANPLPAFLEERCERDPKAKCLLATFYTAYTNWSVEKGYTRVKQSATLSRNIQHLGYTVTKRNSGQTILGLKLKKR